MHELTTAQERAIDDVLHERARVQFGAEAFNLLNHTNRLRVSPYYTGTFGALVEAQNPRQVQLMFQFEY